MEISCFHNYIIRKYDNISNKQRLEYCFFVDTFVYLWHETSKHSLTWAMQEILGWINRIELTDWNAEVLPQYSNMWKCKGELENSMNWGDRSWNLRAQSIDLREKKDYKETI